MSDLVKRLRALVILDEVRSVNTLGKEAAARIEALEAALREIMQAVKDEEWDKAPPHIYEIARAALIAEQDK